MISLRKLYPDFISDFRQAHLGSSADDLDFVGHSYDRINLLAAHLPTSGWKSITTGVSNCTFVIFYGR